MKRVQDLVNGNWETVLFYTRSLKHIKCGLFWISLTSSTSLVKCHSTFTITWPWRYQICPGTGSERFGTFYSQSSCHRSGNTGCFLLLQLKNMCTPSSSLKSNLMTFVFVCVFTLVEVNAISPISYNFHSGTCSWVCQPVLTLYLLVNGYLRCWKEVEQMSGSNYSRTRNYFC